MTLRGSHLVARSNGEGHALGADISLERVPA